MTIQVQEQDHEIWDTYRAVNANARVTYHPEWSPILPWVSYINGTAGRHFGSLNEARYYFSSMGLSLSKEKS